MILMLILILGYGTCCVSNAWNGIVPLRSTRAEVEKILGAPMEGSVNPHSAFYKTKDSKVFVLYSTGLCKDNPEHGWDIPEFTVLRLTVYPDDPPDFEDFKFDKKKFEKHSDVGSISSVTYSNDVDGVGIRVNTFSRVIDAFTYFPEAKYGNLKCKTSK